MSKIEWTEETWNPTTGCTKVSAGCKNCYAEAMAKRLQALGAHGYENGFKISIMEDRLSIPLKRKKPTTYFVNSMSDLFHEDIPRAFLDKVFDVMASTPHHTYQVLTKREHRLYEYCKGKKIPANIFLGVTVENKKAVPRIAVLRKVKSKRFLSIEPLLNDLGKINLNGIDWVIVGGESGRKARPMDPAWVQNVFEQCQKQGIPFFFKQWGAYNEHGVKKNKKANGRIFLDREWNEMPIFPVA